ncbi:hypothetical protein [Micrococcus luteus]|uniref:hypothetical protein n=1 Tax=Micrococcus luteus TaxID=1270 RepID=UPI003018B2FD|nr:hypothetical protein [Micrococcus luteus]
MSAAESVAERVAADRAMFQAGWNAALAAHPPCEHVHPAVADSVARIFHGWDGAEAAHARSVADFHAWHGAARAELLKEGTDLDRHAA